VKKFAFAAIFGALSMFAAPVFAAEKLTTQDYVEIEQLYATYNQAIDNGDAAVWADTFTADGVFSKRFAGREALMGFIKSWVAGGGATRRHWNSNLKITGTPDGANGSVYLILWNVGVKPAAPMTTGKYADVLVKTKDGWRFKIRDVNADAPPAPPAAPALAPAQ
jgi:ketosteroid isomerase-like protein